MLIKPGPATSAMSGKQGGTVASRNRYGQYFRQFSNPVNPATGNQTAARSRLTTASQSWALLTDAQRSLWKDYADLTPVLNRVGDPIILSGQAMYVKVNAFRLQVPALAQLSSPPATPGLGVLPNAGSFDWSLSEADGMVIGAPVVWTDLGLYNTAAAILEVRISPALSPGVKFFGGPWTQAITPSQGLIEGLALPGDDIPVDVVLSQGNRHIVEWRQMDAQGKLSEWARSGVQIVGA